MAFRSVWGFSEIRIPFGGHTRDMSCTTPGTSNLGNYGTIVHCSIRGVNSTATVRAMFSRVGYLGSPVTPE